VKKSNISFRLSRAAAAAVDNFYLHAYSLDSLRAEILASRLI
jgi:hypothetical protein